MVYWYFHKSWIQSTKRNTNLEEVPSFICPVASQKAVWSLGSHLYCLGILSPNTHKNRGQSLHSSGFPFPCVYNVNNKVECYQVTAIKLLLQLIFIIFNVKIIKVLMFRLLQFHVFLRIVWWAYAFCCFLGAYVMQVLLTTLTCICQSSFGVYLGCPLTCPHSTYLWAFV